jgi:hypothetical protein
VALVRANVSEESIASTANVVPSSPILVTLMMKRRFSQEAHGVTSQKTAFFIYIYVQLGPIIGSEL